jgi:nitrogen regulatory protein P-II 1
LAKVTVPLATKSFKNSVIEPRLTRPENTAAINTVTHIHLGGTKNGNPNVKQVIAVVRPYQAEKILENLKWVPMDALSVNEVKGYGRQKSYLDQYSETEFALAFLPKVEITLWVDDIYVEETIRKITEVARSGRMGDGKIMVLPAIRCYDIGST